MKHAYVMTVACVMAWAEEAVEKAPFTSGAVTAVILWWLFL